MGLDGGDINSLLLTPGEELEGFEGRNLEHRRVD
jgi:hypothetical protein